VAQCCTHNPENPGLTFVYTEGLGTTDALVEAVDDWTLALDRPETMCVSILLKDLSKAFDRMQHDRLVRKMIDLGCNSTDIAIARSFLANRNQQVIVNGQRLEVENSDVGVPQGTLSGPIFWLIFADDLQTPIPTVKYADDTTSYDVVTSGNITTMHHTSATDIDVSLGEDRIQSALTYSHQWSKNNGISLNTKKTATLHLSVRKSIQIRNRVSIGDESVQTTRTAKFLGLTIDSHLTFKDHVEERVQKGRRAPYTLIKLKSAGVPPTALVQVYCTRILTR